MDVFEVTGEPAIVISGVPALPAGYARPSLSDAPINANSNSDPCFGDWIEGRKIRKLFDDQYYSGNVSHYDKESNWYKVIYEDGDSEDLDWHELEEVLLPLDISLPLTALAAQRCKSAKSALLSKSTVSKTMKSDTTGTGSMGKKVELSQSDGNCGPTMHKSLNLDFSCLQNQQDNFKSEELVQVVVGSSESQGRMPEPTNYSCNEITVQVLDRLDRFSQTGLIGEGLLKTDSKEEMIAKEAYNHQPVTLMQNLTTAKAEKRKRKGNL